MAEKDAQKPPVAGEDANAQPGVLSSIMTTATSMATTAMNKAQEIDKQYDISGKAMATAQMGVDKAKEINEKYDISGKAGKLYETSKATAKSVDENLGVTKTVGAAVGVVKAQDEKYGVSKTVKGQVSAIDEKLKISETVTKVDGQLGVSNAMRGAIQKAKDTASKLLNSGYKGTAKVGDGEEAVPIIIDAKSKIMTMGEGSQVNSQVIADDCKPVMTDEKVVVGETTLTFASSEDAIKFVGFVEAMLAPKEAKKEEEVAGK